MDRITTAHTEEETEQTSKKTASPKAFLQIPNSAIVALMTGSAPPDNNLRGKRMSIAPMLEARMAAAFGIDISGLKVYRSEAMAGTGMQGLARDNEVVLASDVNLNTLEGQAVLGHELSHIRAQSRGIGMGNSGLLRDASLERQADLEGERAARGMSILQSGMEIVPGLSTEFGMAGVENLTPIGSGLSASAGAPMQAKKNNEDDKESYRGLTPLQKAQKGSWKNLDAKLGHLQQKEADRQALLSQSDDTFNDQKLSSADTPEAMQDLVLSSVPPDTLQKYRPVMHGRLFRSMKANVMSDDGVGDETRQNMFTSLNGLEDQELVIRENYAVWSYAAKVILPMLDPDSPQAEMIRQQLSQAESAMQTHETTAQTVITEYRQNFHTTLGGRYARKRYNDRIANYKKTNPGVSDQAAEEAIQRRSIQPVSMQGLPEIIEKEKQKSSANRRIMKGARRVQVSDERRQSLEENAGKYLKTVLDAGEYNVRTNANAFALIVEDKLKNLHETNTSGGLNVKSLRRSFAVDKFGRQMKTAHASEMETYGYLGSSSPKTMEITKARQYGLVKLTLNKNRMKDRTTMTLGDSLDNRSTIQPTPVSSPGLISVHSDLLKPVMQVGDTYDYIQHETPEEYAQLSPERKRIRARQKKHLSDAEVLLAMDEGKEQEAGYMELQFHGDVTARDIDEVTITIPCAAWYGAKAEKIFRKEFEKAKAQFESIAATVRRVNENPSHYGREKPMVLKGTSHMQLFTGEDAIRTEFQRMEETNYRALYEQEEQELREENNNL